MKNSCASSPHSNRARRPSQILRITAKHAMQQTLLALLALMIATFFNYSQMQANLRNQQQVVRAEMEQMALGVAMQSLEVVRARAFDEATVGETEDVIDTVNDLTEVFPERNHCAAFGGNDTCDDVDDFNEMVPATVPFETQEIDVDFTVNIDVRYVNESMEEVTTPTYRKEVIVRVQDDGDDPYLHRPIRYAEVLTYY